MLASIFVSVCLLLSACGLKSGRSSAEAEEVHKQIMELRHKGEAARKSSRFDEAIRLHREELELATSIGDTISIVRTLNNIGTNYRRLGMLEEATRYHQDALVMTMNCTDQNDEEIKKTKLMSLNGLGNVYLTLGDLKQAEVIFRQALEGEKVIGSKIGQAINLANIGAVKEKQGQMQDLPRSSVPRHFLRRGSEARRFLISGKSIWMEPAWREAPAVFLICRAAFSPEQMKSILSRITG